MYSEVETIVDFYPSWGLEGVKNLSVRERRHWATRVKKRMEQLANV